MTYHRALVLLAALLLGVAWPAIAAKKGKSKDPAQVAKAQIDFGVSMARRGLWDEALFRFRQAERLGGATARLYNNLAVCYEAVGNFEEALANYRKGLELDPANRDLKRNYARFVEFYQSFKPEKVEGDDAAEPAKEAGAGEA